jgi:hypothetical protein
LLRGLAQEEPKPAASEAGATGHPIFDWLDKQFLHAHRSESEHPTAQPVAAASEEALSVDNFRGLVKSGATLACRCSGQ